MYCLALLKDTYVCRSCFNLNLIFYFVFSHQYFTIFTNLSSKLPFAIVTNNKNQTVTVHLKISLTHLQWEQKKFRQKPWLHPEEPHWCCVLLSLRCLFFLFLIYLIPRSRRVISLPGTESQMAQPAVESGSLSSLGRDTAVLLGDLTQGASNWIQSFLDPMRTTGGARSLSSTPRGSPSNETRMTSTRTSTTNCGSRTDYPEGFEPLRSECLAFIRPTSCPIIRNPFVSPVLAPNNLLRGLPPVHIVVRDGRETQGSWVWKSLYFLGQPHLNPEDNLFKHYTLFSMVWNFSWGRATSSWWNYRDNKIFRLIIRLHCPFLYLRMQ